jgi:membrane-associated phospholipid phosphatase
MACNGRDVHRYTSIRVPTIMTGGNMGHRARIIGAALAAMLCVSVAANAGGLLGLDHLVPLDNKGIWARKNQLLLIDAMLLAETGVALWEGGNTRLGRTAWRSIDATVVSGVASEALKFAFTRARPNQTSDPDKWFQGSGHNSFPSGEVTVTSAIVTPFILEYRHDHPSIWALELLPLFDAVGRVKVHGHWQSDVIAGFALGTATGYFMQHRKRTPLVLGMLPHGFYVGFRKELR